MRGQPQMPTSGSEDKGIEHKVRFLARLSLGSPTEDAETGSSAGSISGKWYRKHK